MSISKFIRNYSEEVKQGKAAIFAGAGLSVGEGAVSWKDLLRDEAENIGLDIDIETDLVGVAQYIFNESKSRNRITKLIKTHITSKGEVTKNHKVLAGMSIDTYWTTNYDEYIERALTENGKICDAKKSVEDLALEVSNAHATVYKMHGDINRAHDAVLIKDDYEIYSKKNELFTLALKGDLISKTFLFIGFSFDDPNLENILSKVRIMLEGNHRTHYCFFKEVSIKDNEFKNEKNVKKKRELYEYARNKQELKIKDLKRYGIEAVLVKKYAEITEILQSINKIAQAKTVFISGSHIDNSKSKLKGNIDSFTKKLSRRLVQENFKIVTGYGNGVGYKVVEGALEGNEKNQQNLEEILSMWPFPINIKDEKEKNKKFHEYRVSMISKVGVVIFISGNKLNDQKKVINADGVFKEFKIARKSNKIVIPIGVTGSQSKVIWNKVEWRFKEYYPKANKKIKKLFRSLNNSKLNEEELIENIILLIKEINKINTNSFNRARG